MSELGDLRRLTVPEARKLRSFFESAMARGGTSADWTVDDIFDVLDGKRMVPWGLYLGDELCGVGITRVVRRPRRKLLDVMALAIAPGHSFKQWLPALMMMARDVRADAIIGAGRKGWARALGATQLYSWELPVPGPSLIQTLLNDCTDGRPLGALKEPFGTGSPPESSSKPCSMAEPKKATPSASITSETGYMSDPCGFLQGLALLGVGTSRRGCA